MTMQELIGELMKEADKYAIESEEQIITGVIQARKHKKKRISKKWAKRYGVKPVVETKKCKKIDITLDLIVDFCHENGLPLPDEIIAITTQNDCGGNIDA